MDGKRSGRGLSPASSSHSGTTREMEIVAGVILADFGILRPCCPSVSEAGGMATVYLAQDLRHDRKFLVAVNEQEYSLFLPDLRVVFNWFDELNARFER